jgi:hypothetical protein
LVSQGGDEGGDGVSRLGADEAQDQGGRFAGQGVAAPQGLDQGGHHRWVGTRHQTQGEGGMETQAAAGVLQLLDPLAEGAVVGAEVQGHKSS